jgi:MFS transporter, MHS family, proline/betaine transporter
MTVSAPAELPLRTPAGPEKKDITRLVVAASIGNAMEWYDIAIYGWASARSRYRPRSTT